MRTALFALATIVIASGFTVGCGDDDDTTTTTTTTSGSGGTGAGGTGAGGNVNAPPLPALGTQIDRMGRPAINTATNNTFTPDATRAAAEDAYNQSSNPSDWAAFAPDIAASLGILDAIDETCGNQLLSCNDGSAGCYDALAGVLADDRLHIKADAAMCTTYLAVEADATGALANEDCGGRMPTYDVIQTSYSVLSGIGLSGFDDGIGPTAAAQVEVFPYLQAQ